MNMLKITALLGLLGAALAWFVYATVGGEAPEEMLLRAGDGWTAPSSELSDEALDPVVAASKPEAARHGPSRLQRPLSHEVEEPVDQRAEEAAPAEATATLYQHATHDGGFPGLRWIVNVGATESGRAFGNDEVSAVEVPSGYALFLYQEPGMKGRWTTVGAGLHNLAPYGFNDCVSSVQLVRLDRVLQSGFPGAYGHVWLHEHGLDHDLDPGFAWTLELGKGQSSQLFTARNHDMADNAASAVHVPPRMEVTLFDEPDGRGVALVLGPGMYDLGAVGFNDRASSARVRRMDEGE